MNRAGFVSFRDGLGSLFEIDCIKTLNGARVPVLILKYQRPTTNDLGKFMFSRKNPIKLLQINYRYHKYV